MKKSFLITIIVALAIMLCGIAVCASAKNQAEQNNADISVNDYNENGELVTEYEINTESLSKISLIVPDSDVEVIGCEERSYIEIVNFHVKTYSISNKNGIFEINDTFDISSMLNLGKNDFSFGGIRSIFDMLKAFTDKKMIRVHLCGEDRLNISIETNKGNAKIRNSTEISNLYISSENGNIDIHDMTASSVTVNATYGDVKIDSSEIKKSTFKLHNGDFKYDTSNYYFHNTVAESENGTVRILGKKVSSPYENSSDLAYLNMNIYSINGNIEISGS